LAHQLFERRASRRSSKEEHSHFLRLQAGRTSDWTGFCWSTFVALTVFVICLPFVHSIFGLGDEGILLHGAERLLRGQTLYVDFFEFLPPGGFVTMALWFGVTGISIWSARLLAILTITGIACFTYLACRQASKHAPSSALVAIGWAVMSQGVWTQISHHWFTTFFSMVAAWAALTSIEKPQRWQWEPLISGLAAGAATMVTPTRGALAMLAAAVSFVGLRQRPKLITYVVGSALTPICLLAYVVWTGALAAAFEDVILFTATRYASVQTATGQRSFFSSLESVPFGYFAGDQNWPLKYLFPLVALLTLLTCARDWRACFHDRLFRSCIAFGLAGFMASFPRPDIAHIAFVTPLVCPLLVYCTTRLVVSWAPKYRYALAAFVISLGIPSVAAFSFVASTALNGELIATARGHVTLFSDGARELVARIAATPSSELYFFYPRMAMLPFLTDRKQVSQYDIFTPGYASPSQYQEACVSAMRRASWLVIDRNWTTPDFLRIHFPAITDTEPRETKAFELALQSGFEFTARDGRFELRRRIKGVNESVCASIAE
jgi:hypothetical protein